MKYLLLVLLLAGCAPDPSWDKQPPWRQNSAIAFCETHGGLYNLYSDPIFLNLSCTDGSKAYWEESNRNWEAVLIK